MKLFLVRFQMLKLGEIYGCAVRGRQDDRSADPSSIFALLKSNTAADRRARTADGSRSILSADSADVADISDCVPAVRLPPCCVPDEHFFSAAGPSCHESPHSGVSHSAFQNRSAEGEERHVSDLSSSIYTNTTKNNR